MRDDLELRVLKTGEFLVEKGATVREAARQFGVSKSTVHKDVGERLADLDSALFREVRRVLDKIRRKGICAAASPRGKNTKNVEIMKKITRKEIFVKEGFILFV